jgi:hypothetical protein
MSDKEGRILGIHMVVTFDQPMVTHWAVQRTAIQMRLTAMQQELLMPYRQARCLFHKYTTSRSVGATLVVARDWAGTRPAPTGAGLTKWTSSLPEI